MKPCHPEPSLCILSLGAGVQSSTLYLMAVEGELSFDAAIFADTGWEPQRVYQHVEYLQMLGLSRGGPPIYVTQKGNIREDLLAFSRGERRTMNNPPLFTRTPAGGKGGPLTRQCTSHYKIRQIFREIRRLLKEAGLATPERGAWVRQALGISLDEIHRAGAAQVPWVRNFFPLIDRRMTRQHCLEWVAAHGYERPPKSSCIGCPYHSDAHWLEMQQSAPQDWDDAVAVDHAMRQGGTMNIKGTAYLHRSMRPLDEAIAALSQAREAHGQFDFMNDCSGLCFV